MTSNNLINYSKDKLEQLLSKKIINVYEIFDNEKNLLGCQLIMISKNRIYNFAFARNKNSKSNFGSDFMIDYIIKNFSNSELTLDFEGSMVPSIAKFMQDFGPIEKHYTNYSNLDFLTKKN